MDFYAFTGLPDAGAQYANGVFDGLEEGWKVTLLMKGGSKGWSIERPRKHRQSLVIGNIRELIDEIAQFDHSVGKGDAFDQTAKEELGAKPQMFLKL